MSRQSKSFNVNDLFLQGQNSDVARNLLIRSPLIGSVASVYNRAGGKIRVGAIDTAGDTYIKRVQFVTTKGVPVADITSNNLYDDIYFSTSTGNSLARHKSGWRRLSTTNPKYLQNKLSAKSNHEAAESFDSALIESEAWIGHELRGLLDRLVDKAMGEGVTRAPAFGDGGFGYHIDSSVMTAMARVFAGEIAAHEVTAVTRTEFQRLFDIYATKREKFGNALKTAVEFLTGEKWIYVNDINGGFIAGAISDAGMLAAIDKYKSGEALPTQQMNSFNYVTETVPLQWYPSVECVPEDVRKGIEFSLVMLKTHRNSQVMLPTESGIWHEMGCASLVNGHGASVYVLAK